MTVKLLFMRKEQFFGIFFFFFFSICPICVNNGSGFHSKMNGSLTLKINKGKVVFSVNDILKFIVIVVVVVYLFICIYILNVNGTQLEWFWIDVCINCLNNTVLIWFNSFIFISFHFWNGYSLDLPQQPTHTHRCVSSPKHFVPFWNDTCYEKFLQTFFIYLFEFHEWEKDIFSPSVRTD